MVEVCSQVADLHGSHLVKIVIFKLNQVISLQCDCSVTHCSWKTYSLGAEVSYRVSRKKISEFFLVIVMVGI